METGTDLGRERLMARGAGVEGAGRVAPAATGTGPAICGISRAARGQGGLGRAQMSRPTSSSSAFPFDS